MKEVFIFIKENIIVNVFLLLSVSIIVSFQLSKDTPVWFNWNTDIVNYYFDIVVNLSVGYLVSTIFYVLVVYYPDRKKKLAIKVKTSILFARLQTNLSEFIDCVLRSANQELKDGEDIENSYQPKIENLDLFNLMRNIKISDPFSGDISCLEKSIGAARSIEKIKNQLIPFIAYLENKELDLYLDLEDTFTFENFNDDERLFVKEYLVKHDFHLLVKQFNNCQRIVGASFRNVSWEKII